MKVHLPSKRRKKAGSPGYSRCLGDPRRAIPFPSNDAPYTVIDNGADQAIVGRGWTILKVHGTDRDVVFEGEVVQGSLAP